MAEIKFVLSKVETYLNRIMSADTINNITDSLINILETQINEEKIDIGSSLNVNIETIVDNHIRDIILELKHDDTFDPSKKDEIAKICYDNTKIYILEVFCNKIQKDTIDLVEFMCLQKIKKEVKIVLSKNNYICTYLIQQK